MENYENNMRLQALSLPELMRQQYNDLESKTRTVLTTPEIFSVQRIILTGCGDSHAAAMAIKYTFEELTNIPTEVVPAIELSRFYSKKQLGFAPNNPLVIAVSNSGSVARVGEAMQRARRHGAFTLGITGKRESLLGRSAERILDLNIPPFVSAPGTRSYLVSLMSLHLLAIRIGEVRGCYTMDQAMDYRKDILLQADILEKMLPAMDQQMLQLAGEWKKLEAFDFIGCGSDYATAWFGHAKVFEASGHYAMCMNTEEWLHMNFFMKNIDRIGTIMVCGSDNPGLSRAQELAGYAVNDMKRPTLIVTDDPTAFHTQAIVCPTPKSRYAVSGALTRFVPLCLLTGYIGEMLGEVDGRGCIGPWRFAQDGAGLKNSKLIIDGEEVVC